MLKQAVKRLTPTPVWEQLTKTRQRFRKARTTAVFSSPIAESKNNQTLSVAVAYNSYGGYCLPKSSIHRPAAQKILQGEVWEHKTLEFMSEHIGYGDIVHAGTYFGDFLPKLSAACAENAMIWAFEPNSENYRCAGITILLNDIGNVSLLNAGLGSTESSSAMMTKDRFGKSLGGASHIVTDPLQAEFETETVRIVAIDELIPQDRNISIIQLDVEGYEQQALEGALGTIRRCRPILILETLPGEPWMSDSILSLGYRVREKIDANVILVTDEAAGS